MSNDHGGRRIKMVLYEYPYPHSDSAKEKGLGKPYIIFETSYQRPMQVHRAYREYLDKKATEVLFEVFGLKPIDVNAKDKNIGLNKVHA